MIPEDDRFISDPMKAKRFIATGLNQHPSCLYMHAPASLEYDPAMHREQVDDNDAPASLERPRAWVNSLQLVPWRAAKRSVFGLFSLSCVPLFNPLPSLFNVSMSALPCRISSLSLSGRECVTHGSPPDEPQRASALLSPTSAHAPAALEYDPATH